MADYYYPSDEEIKARIRKKRKRKKVVRFVSIVLIIVLAFVSSTALGKFIGNKQYEKEIATVKVINRNVPIVNTAYKQIGNHGGAPYWSWYGFGGHVAWCACFVSWCENELGYLSQNKGPKFAVTTDGINWFKARNQWHDGSETPKAGDLVFFDWEQNGWDDHVGIVAGTSDDRIYTIEGNSTDMCRIKSYEIGSKVLIGYGRIKRK